MKLLMENWKDYLKEAIVDTPSERLSDVFDDNGVMQEKVIAVIKDAKEKLDKFLSSQNLKITEMFVVGAAVTYQFSPSSDIDTTVVIPNITDEQWKQVDNWMEENLNYSNWSVDGSSRPFQFKPASSNTGYKNVDAAYDPFNKKWIKEPNLETTKQEYNQVVSDPQSKERKMYAFVEKHIQPSLQQLLNMLSNTSLNENISDNIKNAIKNAFKRYEVLKKKRGTAYGEEPSQTGRISQNWGLGNVLYKFLDREGYSEVYGYLKKAIKSDFKIVDQNFINNLKQKLENVLKGEHGYSVKEAKEKNKMAKLTERYLRNMIKQAINEMHDMYDDSPAAINNAANEYDLGGLDSIEETAKRLGVNPMKLKAFIEQEQAQADSFNDMMGDDPNDYLAERKRLLSKSRTAPRRR